MLEVLFTALQNCTLHGCLQKNCDCVSALDIFRICFAEIFNNELDKLRSVCRFKTAG